MAGDKSYGIKQKLMRGKLSAFIICLVVSGFLWLSHRLNQTYYYSLNIPVKFVNLPSNKLLLTDLPDHLRFDIKTSGLKLFFVLLNKPFNEITIDFNTLKGDNKAQAFSISSGNINLRSATKINVDIKKISPDTLFFVGKRGVTKNVAIKPVIMVSPEKGFVIAKPIISPSFITINGDSVSVNGVDSVTTAPLYLNQLSTNYTGKLTLIRPNENVYLNINEVNVSIQTDKILEKKLEIPVAIKNAPPGTMVKLFPTKVTITFSSAKNDFNEINEGSFKAVVNYNKRNNENNKLPLEFSMLPTQAKILSVEPSEVEFLLFKTK